MPDLEQEIAKERQLLAKSTAKANELVVVIKREALEAQSKIQSMEKENVAIKEKNIKYEIAVDRLTNELVQPTSSVDVSSEISELK